MINRNFHDLLVCFEEPANLSTGHDDPGFWLLERGLVRTRITNYVSKESGEQRPPWIGVIRRTLADCAVVNEGNSKMHDGSAEDHNVLIRSAEDLQTLIRQLQEAWLFGQLNTMGSSQAQNETDENAKQVADLLKAVLDHQTETSKTTTNGD
nr:hypothetical protein CFP56_07774 [Quercus suber]